MLDSKGAGMRELTSNQLAFVEAYAGDIKAAAEAVGMSYDYARQLITKPHIVAAIHKRDSERIRPFIMSRQDRQKFWTDVALDKEQAMRDRLRAAELLGKSEADFTDRVEHSGTITYTMEWDDNDAE